MKQMQTIIYLWIQNNDALKNLERKATHVTDCFLYIRILREVSLANYLIPW